MNEEAAKLLLEHYDEYFSRAKMVTEIHAQASTNEKENCNRSETSTSTIVKNSNDELLTNKRLQTTSNNPLKTTLSLSKTVNKDKKRLKRL